MGLIAEYGIAILVVDFFLFSVSTCAFFIILSKGVEMTEILALLETYINIDYWIDLLHVDKSILTGNGSKFVISALASELLSPLRTPVDLGILYLLKRKGIIGKTKGKTKEKENWNILLL